MPTQRQRKAALRYIVAFVCIISSKRKCTPRAEKTPAVKRKQERKGKRQKYNKNI